MKKVLTVFLLLFTIHGNCQDSIHFVNRDATWNVADTYPNANAENPFFVETKTNTFGFEGDTLIDNELWEKFYVTPDSNFTNNLLYLGNLKEEDGVVILMDTNNILETIYNFNLQVGDSVLYKFEFNNQYLAIENIDSIEIDGAFYKQFYFEEPELGFFDLNEIWIEGIGSIHGPLFPAYPTVFSQEIPDSMNLTCYKIENQVLWNNSNYDACYIIIVLSIDKLNIINFKIYPNPAQNEIYISSSNGTMIDEISIYNLHGQKVIHEHQYEGSINVSSLMPGIYFVEVVIGNERIREKLVIE